MQTIWRSLVWREWHEHKWKLAALAAIMFPLQLFVIVTDPGLTTPQIFVWVVCGRAWGVLLGLHAASGERWAGRSNSCGHVQPACDASRSPSWRWGPLRASRRSWPRCC